MSLFDNASASSVHLHRSFCSHCQKGAIHFRHHGIGDALLKMIIKHAAKHVLQLHLTVVTSNQPAIALYQKNGFKIYGTEPRSLKIDTFFYDEHFMIMEYPEQVTSQQNTQNH